MITYRVESASQANNSPALWRSVPARSLTTFLETLQLSGTKYFSLEGLYPKTFALSSTEIIEQIQMKHIVILQVQLLVFLIRAMPYLSTQVEQLSSDH